MKLFDILQLPIVQLLRKFHGNILKNEGAGDNFLGLTLENRKFSNLNYREKKGAEFEYFGQFCRFSLPHKGKC